MKKVILALFLSLVCATAFAFTFNIGGFGQQSDSDSGGIDVGQIMDFVRAGKSLIKSFEDLTPEQEYYLGRAVAARLLTRYKPVDNKAVNAYLQSITNYLVQFSTLPETYGGYHAQLIDSDDPGAFSAPGGYIMITTGLLKRCASEDELAGVLAHEVAHISLKHGLASIKTGHLTEAGEILGSYYLQKEAGTDFRQVQALTKSFGASVEDIVTTIIDSGYSMSQETEADEEAAIILSMAGYQPSSLAEFVGMQAEAEDTSNDLNLIKAFNKTHPGGKERSGELQEFISEHKLRSNESSSARDKRFARYKASF